MARRKKSKKSRSRKGGKFNCKVSKSKSSVSIRCRKGKKK